MNVKKFITVLAVKTKKNEIIPIWDERVVFEKTRDCGDAVKIKGDYEEYFNLIEVVYNLKDKTISLGIELDFYPDKLTHNIGDEVYFECQHKTIYESKIVDIVYKTSDLIISKGKKMGSWYIKYFNDKNIEIDPNAIYCIKQHKPTYVLENGKEVEYEYQLYKKLK